MSGCLHGSLVGRQRPLAVVSQNSSALRKLAQRNAIEILPGTARGIRLKDAFASTGLPLIGRVAAGSPILAESHIEKYVPMDVGLFRPQADYLLRVRGLSMRDAGILDGDTVIIRRCETADNGVIVVALVDGEEATLKRLRRKGESIALEPANKSYETRIFGPDRVRVQGRLIGLLRKY